MTTMVLRPALAGTEPRLSPDDSVTRASKVGRCIGEGQRFVSQLVRRIVILGNLLPES